MRKLLCVVVLFGALVAIPCVADECMDGDCENGVGVGFTEAGKIYQGEWQDGLPHGKGKLIVSKGKYIEGVWEKGKLKKESPK